MRTQSAKRELGKASAAPAAAAAPQATPVWKDLLFLLAKLAGIALVFMVLFSFVFGVMRYQDPAMSPAVKDGDLVVFHRYTKSGYRPQDAVVVKFEGEKQVRRVVATEGDTVDISGGGVIVNGARQQETGIYVETERYEGGVSFPLQVPAGCVFVLGDERHIAADSRVYGPVKIADTLGKVMTVIRRRGI